MEMEMKTFALDNVIKKTNNEVKGNKLLQQGFIEVDGKGKVIGEKLPKDADKLRKALKDARYEIKQLKDEVQKLETEKLETAEITNDAAKDKGIKGE